MRADPLIRRAGPDDLDEAGRICVAAYDRAGQLEPGSPYVETLLDTPTRAMDSLLLVAERDGRIVGTVTICVPGSASAEIGRPDEVEFRFLAVDPPHWGTGVAGALVGACEAYAYEVGARALAICVRDNNAGAAAMYRAMGFERVPDRDWTPRPGVDLLALTRPVRQER
jgi:GNAT superfamily N-acetyltransferase